MLRRPIDAPPSPELPAPLFDTGPFLRLPMDPPIGLHGSVRRAADEDQQSSHFVPIEDRWRIGYPGLGPLWQRPSDHRRLSLHARTVVRPVQPERPQGRLSDHRPAHLPGHHARRPTSTSKGGRSRRQTSGFESTERPFSGNFFGRPNSFFTLNFFSLSFDLFHGDAAFKPVDWRIKLVPTLGVSNFSFRSWAVQPERLQGTTRTRDFWALQEAFVEYKLADLGPDYDFISIRAGTQPFNADFRGFLSLTSTGPSGSSAPTTRTAIS